MSGVVPRVPGVERQGRVEPHQSQLGVAESTGELGVGQGPKQFHPAEVEVFEESERVLHRRGYGVRQFRPRGLVVRFDDRLGFGERQPETDVAVQVAVGDVVYYLADGPPARAVRRVELRLPEPRDRVTKRRRSGGELVDQHRAGFGGNGLGEIEFADGVAQIHVPDGSSIPGPLRAKMEDMNRVGVAALFAVLAPCLRAAELKPRTAEAFEAYIKQVEARLDERKCFLWAEESPERLSQARQGKIVVLPALAQAITALPDGLAHDWMGTVFVPGATLERTLGVMEDYNHHKDLFKPEVVDSRITWQKDHDFKVYMRLRKKQVITVVLDTEHDVRYWPVAEHRWRSVSKTSGIREVEDAGKPQERVLPAGTGNGFLWKLYTYWRFEERDGGTWIECDAVSLTRSVPTGLGWLIEPIIRNLPKDSLENTLKGSRAALAK